MRRLLLILVVRVRRARARPRRAHPLGNFSMNHIAEVSVSADRVDVRYVLDQAEIPTFQERGVARAERVRRKRAEVLRRLRVTADGRPLALHARHRARSRSRPAPGGLQTTRFELALRRRGRARARRRVRDGTYPGRVGWRAIVARPGAGTAVRSSAPATDPTRGPHAATRRTRSRARPTSATRDARASRPATARLAAPARRDGGGRAGSGGDRAATASPASSPTPPPAAAC